MGPRRYNVSELNEWLPVESRDAHRGSPFTVPRQILDGTRNDTLYRLSRSLYAKGLAPEAVRAAVVTTNATQCQPPLPDEEIEVLLQHAATQLHDRAWRGEQTEGSQSESIPNAPVPAMPPPAGAVVTQLSTVTPEAVTWLWPGRLARGKITVLAGDPGLGKSFITLDVASRLTRGWSWPDGGVGTRGDVVLLSAEDGPSDTIRPRVDALGGDPERVYLLRAIRDADGERPVSLDRDLVHLEQILVDHRPPLVVIDPLTAYLGTTDSYRDADVRRLLAPLAQLAETHDVAVLLVMHLTKNSQTRALYRTGGSIAFVGAARVQLLVGSDPEDATRRILAPGKNNLAAPPAALAYRLLQEGPGGPPRLVWDPDPVEPGLDADALLASTADDPGARRDAEAIIQELLGDGERLSTELTRAARAHGISERTLDRARRRLGVKTRHEGQPGQRGGVWYCFLPEPAPPKAATSPPKAAISPEVAVFGEASERTDETARTSPKAATSLGMAPFGGGLRDDGGLEASAPTPEERL